MAWKGGVNLRLVDRPLGLQLGIAESGLERLDDLGLGFGGDGGLLVNLDDVHDQISFGLAGRKSAHREVIGPFHRTL